MIPTNEQPYPLPDGWQWCRLGDVCNFIGGGTPSKDVASYWSGDIPWASVKDIKGDYLFDTIDKITEAGLKNSSANLCEIDDLILVTRIEPGKSIVAKIVSAVNQDLKIIKSSLPAKFLHYFFKSVRQEIESMSSGSTVKGITLKKLENFPIPLPPLDEQQRIVALLDELFADLDEAKTLAQAVVDGSKLRRAAILHKAFIGELSKLWRDEHGATLNSWQRRTVASVCKSLVYGTSKKSKSSGKIIVLRMGNLQGGEIDWKDLAYSDDEADIKKYLLSKDDVIFNRTNSAELVGKTSIYRGEYPAIYAGYLIKLDYDRDVLSGEYLNYVLNSPAAKEYCNHVKTDGVNQSNINAKKIGAYVIPLPPPEEQKEIVRLLDDLLGREQQTKNLAGKTLEHIEILRKSILSRVFRGELVLGEQF